MDLVAQTTLTSIVQSTLLAPVATAVPFIPAQELFRRATTSSASTDTCGYFTYEEGWMTHECPGGTCTTSGSYYGCNLWFFTACNDRTASACGKSSIDKLGDLDLCCTETEWPLCGTLSKQVSGDWITNYECWASPVSGTYRAFDSTETTTESVPVSTMSEPTGEPTNSSSSDSNDSGSGSSSQTNVGAIVGGVLGGLALAAAIGFGVWFMRTRNAPKGGKEEGIAQLHGDSIPKEPSYPMHQSPNMYHLQPGYAQTPKSINAHAVEAPTDSPRAELPT